MKIFLRAMKEILGIKNNTTPRKLVRDLDETCDELQSQKKSQLHAIIVKAIRTRERTKKF